MSVLRKLAVLTALLSVSPSAFAECGKMMLVEDPKKQPSEYGTVVSTTKMANITSYAIDIGDDGTIDLGLYDSDSDGEMNLVLYMCLSGSD